VGSSVPRSLPSLLRAFKRFEECLRLLACWPLHDIVITNIARCMAYKREVEGRVVYCSIVVPQYCSSVGNAGGPEE